jgi:hypothetical protein
MGRNRRVVCVTVPGCRCLGPLEGCCEAAEGPVRSSRLGSIRALAGGVGVLGSLSVSQQEGVKSVAAQCQVCPHQVKLAAALHAA